MEKNLIQYLSKNLSIAQKHIPKLIRRYDLFYKRRLHLETTFRHNRRLKSELNPTNFLTMVARNIESEKEKAKQKGKSRRQRALHERKLALIEYYPLTSSDEMLCKYYVEFYFYEFMLTHPTAYNAYLLAINGEITWEECHRFIYFLAKKKTEWQRDNEFEGNQVSTEDFDDYAAAAEYERGKGGKYIDEFHRELNIPDDEGLTAEDRFNIIFKNLHLYERAPYKRSIGKTTLKNKRSFLIKYRNRFKPYNKYNY